MNHRVKASCDISLWVQTSVCGGDGGPAVLQSEVPGSKPSYTHTLPLCDLAQAANVL